jgi:hypothetical protein
MIKMAVNFIYKSYPYFYKQRLINFFIALFAGGTVAHSMFLLRPEIVVANIHTSYTIAVISYALITFSSIILWTEFVSKFLDNAIKDWRVYNELILSVTCIGWMGFFNYIYIYLFGELEFNSMNFDVALMIHTIATTLFSGIVPLSIISLFNFLRYEKANKIKTNLEEITFKDKPTTPEGPGIPDEIEIFNVSLKDISIIESMGNYIKIYQEKSDQVSVKRETMKRVEELLKDQKILVRVHRSYFINISHIVRIHKSGSGDISIVSKFRNTHIPISRSKKKELHAIITNGRNFF